MKYEGMTMSSFLQGVELDCPSDTTGKNLWRHILDWALSSVDSTDEGLIVVDFG